MVKYVYLDQNHWITLSRVHIKGKGSETEKKVYKLLLKAVEDEEVITPLSLVHQLEVSGASFDIERRRNLAKTIVTFTRSNCIQPLPVTLDYEAKYATIKILSENLVGRDKVKAQTHHDLVANVKDRYPYFPIGKGVSALLGAFPSLTGTKSKEEYDYIMKHVLDFLNNPDTLTDLAINEFTQKMYNQLKSVDFKEIIKKEEELIKQRKLIRDKTRRKEFKFVQFLVMSEMSETIVRHILHWSERLGINYYEGIEKTLNFEEGTDYDDSKKNITYLMQNIPSAWCRFNLEYYRDRHYERKIDHTDIFDIYSIANAIPYCDIVLCDKFYSNAVKSTELDVFFKTKVSHELGLLEQELRK